MKSVMIALKPEQYEWMKSRHMNISSFVRAQIERYKMKEGSEINGKGVNREI